MEYLYNDMDNFISMCFVEWQKQTKEYDAVVIENFDKNKTTDLLFLKVASLSSSIYKAPVYLKVNPIKYFFIKLKTQTNIPRFKKLDSAIKYKYIDCSDTDFFNRPVNAVGASLSIVEATYNEYYKEYEYGRFKLLY